MAESARGPHAKATLQPLRVPARRVELAVGAREGSPLHRCTHRCSNICCPTLPPSARSSLVRCYLDTPVPSTSRGVRVVLSRFLACCFLAGLCERCCSFAKFGKRKIVPLAKGYFGELERKCGPAHCVSSLACGRRFAVFGTFLGTSCLLLFFFFFSSDLVRAQFFSF